MSASVDQPSKLRFTVEHVHALADAGFFDPVDRVELIGGEIYVTPPPGEQHTTVSIRLDAFLRGRAGPERYVTREATLQLPSGDLVTADLCVLDCPATAFVGYPPVEHLALVIEIAMTSQEMDRGSKLERYATAGIPQYWVIDIPAKTVEVYTLPSANRYRRTELYGQDDTIAEVPGTSAPLEVAELFPPGIDWG